MMTNYETANTNTTARTASAACRNLRRTTTPYSPTPSPSLFLFHYTPTTKIYTLSLHDALPIYVHPVNIQTACLIMEGAEFTENIINGVERPVKAAELFAFTLRVRAGNTDVLTDAEENVRQKLRAEGVM